MMLFDKKLYLNLINLYFKYFPINKGKYRILNFLLNISKDTSKKYIISSKDGRKFNADLNEPMYKGVFCTGFYEKHETEIVKKIIKEGDVTFDIGANFGWYTTLFATLVGKTGSVHSFEPVPSIFDQLKHNVEINDLNDGVILNDFALGAEEGQTTLHLFKGLPSGHASISDLGRDDYVQYQIPIMTLDKYIFDKGITKVDFVKCDVEGAEMMVIKGATHLFSSNNPPIILVEMNITTSNLFGYKPEDPLKEIQKLNEYKFFKVINGKKIKELERLNIYENGDNILCLPKAKNNILIDDIVQR